jgi:hypothetical protein
VFENQSACTIFACISQAGAAIVRGETWLMAFSAAERRSTMKIGGFDLGLDRIAGDRPAQSAPVPGAGGFGEILKQALGEGAFATAESGAVAPPPAALAIRPVDSPPAAEAAGRVERLLDLLDRYRQNLVDPRVDLKALDGAVGDVEKGMDALKPALGSLPANDGLREIVNRALVTASVEIVKFRRGDYLAA